MEQEITEQQFRDEPLREDDTGLWLFDKCIMYKEELPYITKGVELICEKIKPKKVLELGFGYGWTATKFQECGVEKHIIIEAHPEVYAQALEWKEQYPDKDIEIIFDFWQNITLEEEFDLVYYDTFEIVDIKNSIEWDLTNLKGEYWATCYADYDETFADYKEPNFIFEVEGEKYFQSLYKI